MAALTANRDTKDAAATTCVAGRRIGHHLRRRTGRPDANGRATPGATATTLRGVGWQPKKVTNGSTAGAVSVEVDKGIFASATPLPPMPSPPRTSCRLLHR